jgi:uncharacterized protein (TIGR00266 family)
MEVKTRQGPAFGVARVLLEGGEHVRVEGGAMMAMSAGVVLESKAQGGVMKSLKRATLGGESFFVSTFHAPAQGGFVDVAAHLPGDVHVVDMKPDKALFVSKGSWVASASTIAIETRWGGYKNLFGAEGGFILRAEGQGPLVFACYGALETWNLEPGHTVTIDTGHMVAYEETVQLQLRKASGGLANTFKSGEGLVFDFTGPGTLWTQTRNPNEFLGWIGAMVGSGSGGVTTGGPGGLFGRS